MASASDSHMNFGTFDFESVAILSKFINKGAYGDVYGPFEWNRKKCAFKRILIGEDTSDAFEKKVKEKKNIWTSLKHKNLIEIHYVSLKEKALYLVMEYAGGGSLSSFLHKSAVSFHVSNFARQIAEGMMFLHAHGVVHRDLKPGNTMIMGSCNDHGQMILKITDFDDVKEHTHTTTMSVRGTCAYMAPEVLEKQWVSKASDVWSYGVLVWEMLTREIPHAGLQMGPLIVKATSRQLALDIRESISDAYKKLLRDCLCHDTNGRPSFKEIIQELSSIDSSEDFGEQSQQDEGTDAPDGPAGERQIDSEDPPRDYSSASLCNDEIKHRIQNVYSAFVSDVDPDKLSDWLMQENVMTIDEWQRIRHENAAKQDRCRALLHHLFLNQHPRAFLVVRQALSDDEHYLLEYIDSKETVTVGGISVQQNTRTTVRGLLTNDVIKLRIQKIFVKFVSDVDADRLSDWLIQENVLTADQWQRIRHENPPPDRCRALLNYLLSIHHPRAFLVVREALMKENHYLLEFINDRESQSMTNDEVKQRIQNVYAKFVSDVEPDRLSDWLVQEQVITIDEKQRIRNTNHVTTARCRALLDHLFSIQHPRAFLVVREALSKENHYLLEYIDKEKM